MSDAMKRSTANSKTQKENICKGADSQAQVANVESGTSGESLRDDYKFVTAIDFGTTYSGWAYSSRNNFLSDQQPVFAFQWVNGETIMNKTNACILFDKEGRDKGRYHSCGYEAVELYKEKCASKQTENWFYFSNYKMILYDNMNISQATMLSAANGEEMQALIVFSETIRFFMEHFKIEIAKQYGAISNEDIRWVLTVPTIWNEKAKQFMRKAAERAGIPSNQLVIALEPEAAALFCKTLPIQKDKMIFTVFKPKTKYMVLDLGGGTYDITVNMMTSDGLEELHIANGGRHGGNNVNATFWDLLIHLFSRETVDKFREQFPEDELFLDSSFESKKMTIKVDDPRTTLSIHLPASLHTMIKQGKSGTQLDELSKKFSKEEIEVDMHTSKIKVDIATIQRLFQKPVMEIYRAATDILSDLNFLDLRFVLLVGGFSDSPYVHQRLVEYFQRDFKKIQVLRPAEAANAVVKGAVTFGHDLLVYKNRVCRYTYGIQMNAPFDERLDPEDKVSLNEKRERFCNIRFSKLVEIGTRLETGKFVEGKTYQPFQTNQKKVTFPFYVSKNRNPRFTYECELLGTLSIVLSGLSKKDEKIKIEVKFGDTELATVRATEVKTGKEAFAELQFIG